MQSSHSRYVKTIDVTRLFMISPHGKFSMYEFEIFSVLSS